LSSIGRIEEDMATTTARRRTTRPMSYYWGVVKDMDDSQKLELMTMLVESVKPKMVAPAPMKRFTMDEINAMLDEAEAPQGVPAADKSGGCAGATQFALLDW